MAWNVRSFVAMTIPTLGLLIGLFWFRKRKSSNSLDYRRPPDKSAKKERNLAAGDGVHVDSSVKVQEHPVPVEEELVAAIDSSVASTARVLCEEPSAVVEDAVEAVNNNVAEAAIPEEDANTKPLVNRVKVNGVASDDVISEVSFDSSFSGKAEKINDLVDNTSSLSWAANVEQAEVRKQCQIEEQNTIDANSRTCKPDIEKQSESTSTPLQYSSTGSDVKNSEKPTPTKLNSDKTGQLNKIAASPEVAKSQLSVTNSTPNGLVCVSTEEEVSSTLNGGKSHSSSLAVSSESPNSMNSTGSSDSGSCDHDIRSEVSADSGRGGSVAEMSSPVTIPDGTPVIYEFDFPTDRCGMLIGKNGRTINRIKDLAQVEISVNRKMYTQDYQLVVLTGTQCQIDKALVLLRDRFPIDRFPDITFKPAQQEGPMLQPEMMQLSLPEGVYVDVLVSSVVGPNHIFLQQPTHPTFHMLETLNQCMNTCYTQENLVPELPRPIETGVICAAPMYDTGWYRSQIVQSNPETDEVELKFVDFGGYLTTQGCLLRQIRSDFSQLPFQAVECYLANVMPPNGAEIFPAESNAMMEQMVQGKMLQAQVVGHEADGVPYIQLYDMQGEQTVLVNRELVNSGLAQWIEHLL